MICTALLVTKRETWGYSQPPRGAIEVEIASYVICEEWCCVTSQSAARPRNKRDVSLLRQLKLVIILNILSPKLGYSLTSPSSYRTVWTAVSPSRDKLVRGPAGPRGARRTAVTVPEYHTFSLHRTDTRLCSNTSGSSSLRRDATM